MRMAKPVLAGAFMAFAMLFFMHDAIMSGNATLTSGTITFVLLHTIVILMLASLVFFVPPARRFVKAHRPSRHHVLGMVLGLVVAGGSAHILMHGIA